MKIKAKVHFEHKKKGRKALVKGAAKTEVERPKAIPRVAKLMALAIKLDEMIRQGVVKDHAEIARLGQVSRARVSQVMGLLNLAAGVQEKVLLGTSEFSERQLRSMSSIENWAGQGLTGYFNMSGTARSKFDSTDSTS